MPRFDVQTGYAYALPNGEITTAGIDDEVQDLDTLPDEEEVVGDLKALRYGRDGDDPKDSAYRRVYIGEDTDGNFTQILLDVTVPADA